MIDRGGEDYLSEGQKSMCRRAATLEVNIEQMEATMSEGQGVDLDLYNRLAGNLRRVFETLGLERVSRDMTPRLSDYLQAKAETAVEPVIEAIEEA
jgi:hypothetical protein